MCHVCCPCIDGRVEFRRQYCLFGYSPCLTWCQWCRRAHDSEHNNKRWLPLTGLPLLYFLWCHVALDFGQLCNWLCTGGYVGKRCTCECTEEPYDNNSVSGCPTWSQWLEVALGPGSPIDMDWTVEQVNNRRKKKPKSAWPAEHQPSSPSQQVVVDVHNPDFDLPDDLS